MRKLRVVALSVVGVLLVTVMAAGFVPAFAIDAHDPNVLVAGSNDFIDQQPCPRETALTIGSCLTEPRPNTGVSGVYFSFDRGRSWMQPTYTGWTRRDCDPATVC